MLVLQLSYMSVNRAPGDNGGIDDTHPTQAHGWAGGAHRKARLAGQYASAWPVELPIWYKFLKINPISAGSIFEGVQT